MPRKRTSSPENPDASPEPVPDSVAMPPPPPSCRRKSSRIAAPSLIIPDSIIMPPPSNPPLKRAAHGARSVFMQLPEVQPALQKIAGTPELSSPTSSAHSLSTPVTVTTYMSPPSLPSSPPPARASEIIPPPAVSSVPKESIETKLQSERASPVIHSAASEEAPRDVSTPTFNGSSTSMPPPVAPTSKGVSVVMPPPATPTDVSVALFDATAPVTISSSVPSSTSESVKMPLPTIPLTTKETTEMSASPDVPSTSKGVVAPEAEI